MRRHSCHRVDLTAELRHEEAVHDAGGGQLEADRCTDRDDKMIDAGDALVGVDEQPFPIEGDDLDGDGLDLRGDRLARIEVMRSNPGDAADQEHRHQRDRPDEHFNTARIDKVGPVACARVGCTKPKCDSQRRQDHRDDDRQHDTERVEQDLPFREGDRSLRI